MKAAASGPFALEGAVYLVRPSGARAWSLDDLARGIEAAEPAALFHHAAAHRLRHAAVDEEPADDFSAWVESVLLDAATAERLAFAVRHCGDTAAETRGALLDVLRSVPEAARRARVAPEEYAFEFLLSEPVAIPLGLEAEDGDALFAALAEADPGVWFHLLVERPWYGEGDRAPAAWLRARGEARHAGWLEAASAPGVAVEAMRRLALRRWRRGRVRHAIVAAAARPETQRREAGRAVAASLARRLAGGTRDE